MNIDRWPVSALLVAAPAIAFFGMWWWRHSQRWS
jgi:hypothetical protein